MHIRCCTDFVVRDFDMSQMLGADHRLPDDMLRMLRDGADRLQALWNFRMYQGEKSELIFDFARAR